jgi:hypothetical protein
MKGYSFLGTTEERIAPAVKNTRRQRPSSISKPDKGPTGISIIKVQRKAAKIALLCFDNKTYVLLCQADYEK